MSWVPSPSGRLSASYREVSVPTVLGTTQRGSSVKTNVASNATSTVKSHVSVSSVSQVAAQTAATQSPTMGHLAPGPMPRQQTGSAAIGSPVGRPAAPSSGFTMPSPSTAFATALPANQAPFPPILSQMGSMPYSTPIGPPSVDELSRSLTMLPFSMPMMSHGADLLGSPASSPHHRDVATSSTSKPSNVDPPPVRQFGHKKSPSYTQVPGPVCVNIYWQRPVAFDDKGRAQRRLGGGDLTWGKKFLKDVIGVYHVGVEVYGQEYTFGNYHAPGSRQVGGDRSGVFAHEPRRPGPHCIFKQAEKLGKTSVHPSEVEDFCVEFGNFDWSKGSYNKIHHNCVDFAKTLCARLDVDEIPAWCYRGAAIGKLLGIGGPDPEEEQEHDISGETNGSLGTAHDDMDTRIGHHRLTDQNRLTGSFAGPVGKDAVRTHTSMPSVSSTAPAHPDVRQHGKETNGVTMVVTNGITKGPSYVAPPLEAITGARGPSYVAPPVEAVTGARGPSYVAPPVGLAQNRGPSYVAPPVEVTGARGPSYVAPPVEVRGARGPSYVAPPVDASAAIAAAVAAGAAAAAAAANAQPVTATGSGARGASFVSAPMTMPSSTYVTTTSPPSYVAPPGRPASQIAPQVGASSTAIMTGTVVQSATMPGTVHSVAQPVPQGMPKGQQPRLAQASVTTVRSTQAAPAAAQPAASIRSASEEKAPTLSASRRVTVLQSNGKWATGKIVCQDSTDKYTVIYDANWSTEANVQVNRIVALPEDSNSRQSVGQAPRTNDTTKMQGFQASTTNHCRTNTNGGYSREQHFPTFAAPAGTSTSGGFQQRTSMGSATSTTSAPFRFTATQPAQTQSAASSVPAVSSAHYSTHYSGRGKDLGATWR